MYFLSQRRLLLPDPRRGLAPLRPSLYRHHHVRGFRPVHLTHIPPLYLSLVEGRSLDLSLRVELPHNALQGLDVLFLLLDGELGVVELVPEFVELVKQFLPFRSQRPESLFHLVLVFEAAISLNNPESSHKYFLSRSETTFSLARFFFSFSMSRRKLVISLSFCFWVDKELR